ncbi:MAG TPA: hypothetical protein VKU85_02045, partial [bacterium]|nr:hypothetical protein [bacterium]
MRPRPALRSVFPRLLPLVWILAAGGAAADAPPRSQVTAEDWRADLTLLLEELEAVHPDPWFHASRAEVVAEADELRERLPDLTWEESFAGLHRIVAMLRDGHTSFPLHRNEALGLRRVQVQYRLFGDELRVVRVHPDHAEVLGGRVTRIGDVDADEAIRRMAELVPADNDWTVRDRLPHSLTVADLLV